ncbi:hypothetical protein QQP08_007170, partial [Theobroma cacao]
GKLGFWNSPINNILFPLSKTTPRHLGWHFALGPPLFSFQSFDRGAANLSWVTLTSGTLTPKPTALALVPAVCAETPMPSSGSTDLCVADSASVAMPRKLDLSSTAEEFKWCEVGRNSSIMSHFSLVFEF